MDQLLEVLQDIRDGIYSMNSNIEQLIDSVGELKGSGLYNSISDVCDKLDSVSSTVEAIKGVGLYDTISDVCDKLDSISSSLESIDINTA